jgi:hypothetical protein
MIRPGTITSRTRRPAAGQATLTSGDRRWFAQRSSQPRYSQFNEIEHRTLRYANRILIEGDPLPRPFDQATRPQGRAVTGLAPTLERADKWISRAATATVAGLAGIAGAISYSHMRMLAAAHGDTGWHAHAFPLSVDGMEIVASLVLLADRRAGRKSGWLPWTALTIGTAASLAANIATADTGIVSRVIAGWPAVALLIAVKLLSGILEHREPAAIPAPASADGTPAPGRPRPASQSRTVPAAAAPGDLAALENAARTIRDELRRDGRPLTRDALAARLRAAGYPVRNATLTPLLAALRAETAPVT